MDIIKIGRLIEDIAYHGHTVREKLYYIGEAVKDKTISEEDAEKLRSEYATPERSDNPWSYAYTVVYYGALYDGDIPNDYNEIGYNDSASWRSLVNTYGDDLKITVYNNEYGVTYDTVSKEWD